jgi:hypothetical protein
MCFGPRESTEALNHGQRETLGQTRRLEEMIGDRLQLPPIISTGFLYVMDATGRQHTLTMDMAHSLEVCSCPRYVMLFVLHLWKFPAIYRSSQDFIFPRAASKSSPAETYGYRSLRSDY